MSFMLFLRGFVAVLLVFAITSYLVTQSLWTTLVQTVICAILIQVGYFCAVLFLVWRAGDKPKEAADEPPPAQPADEQPGGNAARLPGVPRSRHP